MNELLRVVAFNNMFKLMDANNCMHGANNNMNKDTNVLRLLNSSFQLYTDCWFSSTTTRSLVFIGGIPTIAMQPS